MADLILGLSNLERFSEMVSAAEQEVLRTLGVACKVSMTSPYVEAIARRADGNAPFTELAFRARIEWDGMNSLEDMLKPFTDVCVVERDDEWLSVQYPGNGAPATAERFAEIADACGNGIEMPEVWHVFGDDFQEQPLNLEKVFKGLLDNNASDMHLMPGEPPVLRIDNVLKRREDICGTLSSKQLERMVEQIAPGEAWEEFCTEMQTSFNYHHVGLGYSRVSAFRKQGSVHVTFRYLPEKIPSFEELNLPGDVLEEMSQTERGLFLIVGMTGSGKTTTMASMADYINRFRNRHVIFIEHPVEYVHHNNESIVSQRDVGIDVLDFGEAVRGSLRHDPDVIVIGEMRDADTIRSAIAAAATGHLVLSTLHSNTAAEVVNRIVSFFDPVERDLVRLQLRDCLRGVICQRLVPRTGGGRVPAIEVMFNDIKPINDAIIEGDTDGIHIGMEQTTSHSFIIERYLHKLLKDKIVDLDAAREAATDVSVLDQMMIGTYSVPRLEGLKGKNHQAG